MVFNKKRILSLVFVSLLILTSCRGKTYLEYCIGNHSSHPVLVSFFDGETTKLEFHYLAADQGLGLGVVDLGKVRNPSEHFECLWKNNSSEFRIYSLDTTLLKIWKPNFNFQSKQKEFFRESDWRRDEFGEWNINTVDYYFEIQDSDLAPVGSVSAQ